MTKQELDQIAELTRTVNAMSIQLNKNTTDTAEIKLTMASWTGGRRTLVWVIGVLLSVGIIISSVYEAIKASVK